MAKSSITERASFVRKVFGTSHIARDGINVAVKCPSCSNNSDKKKFSINLETWQCHCWVCEERAKTLLPIIRKFKPGFIDEYRSKFIGEGIYGSEKEKEVDDENICLPPDFTLLVDSFNTRDPNIKAGISYLKKRGLSKRDFWYFKIGYSPHGKFRRKVIIPSFDMFGDLNFFVSRSIDADSRMKYLNSKNSKNKIIFNELNIDWKKELTITEGPFDLISCNSNATCLLGSNLSNRNILFSKIVYNKTPVLLALDKDMTRKSQKIAELLNSYSIDVRILDLKDFQDVGEMNKETFKNLKSRARIWSRNESLIYKIRSLESGSLL